MLLSKRSEVLRRTDAYDCGANESQLEGPCCEVPAAPNESVSLGCEGPTESEMYSAGAPQSTLPKTFGF